MKINPHYIMVDLYRVPPQVEDEPAVYFTSSVGSLSLGFLMGGATSRLDAQFFSQSFPKLHEIEAPT